MTADPILPATSEEFAAGCVHVRWIEHDAIDRGIAIGQFPTIDTSNHIARLNFLIFTLHLFPKYAFSIGDVSNDALFRDVQLQDIRKNVVITCSICRENQLVG